VRRSVSSLQVPTRPGIPAITPYPMPTAAELPANTAPWVLDRSRAVLLIHDMQKYFLRHFPAGEEPVIELVRNVTRLRGRCAELNIPVCYTMQPGSMTVQQRGLLADFWGPGMSCEPADREVVEPLRPRAHDWTLPKWRYSAFHRTALLSRMRSSCRDQLIVCGVYAHVGVLMSVCDAFSYDIQPFLAADAVADFTPVDHRMALDYAARRCAVVRPTDDMLSQLVRHG
jgi:isochorismate hydrolase